MRKVCQDVHLEPTLIPILGHKFKSKVIIIANK